MKVALVHELLTMRGGAERVLRVFAEMFPDAPIYTFLYDERVLGDWFPRERVRVSRLQKTAWASHNHHRYLPFFPSAAEAWDFSEYDLVLSSSSAFAHGILTNGKPVHVCYVHSPARYLWDRTHDVLSGGNPIRRLLASRLFHRLRVWDAEAAERADVLVAPSHTVRQRIERYWRREAQVIPPPIDDRWLQGALPDSPGSYLLIASTLAPYKRLDLAVRACSQAGLPLKIAGDGADAARLRSLAGPTVEFLGYQDGDALQNLYRNASAVLFPGDEDFGLVPLEALATGRPVVAFKAGGATETLTEGVHGTFFDEPTPESLLGAVRRLETLAIDPAALRTHASAYSTARFRKSMTDVLDRALEGSTLAT